MPTLRVPPVHLQLRMNQVMLKPSRLLKKNSFPHKQHDFVPLQKQCNGYAQKAAAISPRHPNSNYIRITDFIVISSMVAGISKLSRWLSSSLLHSRTQSTHVSANGGPFSICTRQLQILAELRHSRVAQRLYRA